MAKEDEELEPAWRQEALDALAAEPTLTGAGGAPGTAAPSPDPPPQHAQPEVVQQSAPAETGGGATGSWEYEPGAEPPAADVPGHPLDDPRTADQEWTRAYMVLQQRAGKKVGAPKVPQEVISESAQVQRGVLGPAASAAHAGALVRGAEAQAEKREIQQQIEQHDAQVELQALKKLQEEHRKFAALRDRELAEARAKRERANQIGMEIAAEARSPAREGLFSSKDGAKNVFNVIALAMLAVGTGLRARAGNQNALRDAMAIINDWKTREVRNQARRVELKRGAVNELGTMVERHLANIADAELAAKATELDLLREAKVEAQEFALRHAPELGKAETELFLAQLDQAIIQTQAELDQRFGDKVVTAIDRKWQQPLNLAERAIAELNARLATRQQQQAAAPPPAATPEEYFAQLAQQQAAPPVDPEVAEALGLPPPRPPEQPQQRPVQPSIPRARNHQEALRAKPTTAQDMAARAQKYERIIDNLTSGRLSEVVADLPDDVAALLAKSAEDFMASDPDVKGSPAAAAHKVFRAWFGEGVPRRPLSPSERERKVTSAFGEVYLSPTKEQAAKDREKLQTIDSLLLNLETMEKLVEPYRALGFQHVPEDVRGQIVTLGTVIAAQASQSLEMGVIQKWDAELWRDMSGEKLANWWRSMLTDRFESLRAFRTESKRRRLAFVKTLEQIAGPKFGIRDEQKVKDPDRAVRP